MKEKTALPNVLLFSPRTNNLPNKISVYSAFGSDLFLFPEMNFDAYWTSVVDSQSTRVVKTCPALLLTRLGHVADLRECYELRAGKHSPAPHYATLRFKKLPPVTETDVDIDKFISEMAEFSRSLEARTLELRREKAKVVKGRNEKRDLSVIGESATMPRGFKITKTSNISSEISRKEDGNNGHVSLTDLTARMGVLEKPSGNAVKQVAPLRSISQRRDRTKVRLENISSMFAFN